MEPVFTNDAIVLGILFAILAFVFKTSHSSNPFWKKFYTYVPSLLLCYFIPSLLNSMGIISGENSNLPLHPLSSTPWQPQVHSLSPLNYTPRI